MIFDDGEIPLRLGGQGFNFLVGIIWMLPRVVDDCSPRAENIPSVVDAAPSLLRLKKPHVRLAVADVPAPFGEEIFFGNSKFCRHRRTPSRFRRPIFT